MGILKKLFSQKPKVKERVNPDDVRTAFAELERVLNDCKNQFNIRVGEQEFSSIGRLLSRTKPEEECETISIEFHHLLRHMRQELSALKVEAARCPSSMINGLVIESYIAYKELLISDLTKAIEQFDERCRICHT